MKPASEKLSTARRAGELSVYALAVLIAAAVFFLHDLDEASLPTRDDAYHAQTAKEMVQTGDFIGIRFGGHLSFQSSPLPAWLMAASYSLFGVSEFSARLPMALCGLLTVLIVFHFVRCRWGEGSAILAASILVLNAMFPRYARYAMAEAPLTLFTALALLFAWKGAVEERRNYLWFGCFAGLAVLTKSALGLLPVLVVILWLLTTGRVNLLFSREFFVGLLLMLVVISIWYGPALIIYGETFVDSHLGAYLGAHALDGHSAGQGLADAMYYFYRFPLEFLPWSIFLIHALWMGFRAYRDGRGLSLFALSIVLPLVLLSFMSTKYSRYLIPVIPAASILISATFWHRWNPRWQNRLKRSLAILMVGLALTIVVFPVQLGEDQNAAVRDLAPAIRSVATERYEIINYQLDFWRYQSPLLFYSDIGLSQPLASVEELKAKLPAGIKRVGLTATGAIDALRAELQRRFSFSIVEEAGPLVLFSAEQMSFTTWMADARLIAKELRKRDLPPVLGSWRVQAAGVSSRAFKENHLRLLPHGDTIRSAFNRMLGMGSEYGVAWREDIPALLEAGGNIFNLEVLALGERLALFHVERRVEPGGG